MVLFTKPLLSVTEKDLLDLIANQVAEGKTIDYKLALPGTSDDDKKEFLADISSFANTSGGYLIFGMDEVQGVASKLPGISELDPDKEKLRIENIIRDGIAPRVAGISIHIVDLSNGSSVFILYVPRSWLSPHMVTFKNVSRFYARNSAGKYQLDVQEIRQAFLLSESITERIRNYQIERLSQIGAGNTPIFIGDNAKLVLHCLPVSSFQSEQLIDIETAGQTYYNFFAKERFSSRYNLDGILLFFDFEGNSLPPEYLQVYRKSQIEYVNGYLLGYDVWHKQKNNVIPITDVESEIIRVSKNILNYQRSLGVEPPVVISLNLLNVKGFVFSTPTHLRVVSAYHNRGIDRDNLIIPNIMIESYPESDDDMSKALKPLFDSIWNAAGWPRSMSYDENGVWHSRQ